MTIFNASSHVLFVIKNYLVTTFSFVIFQFACEILVIRKMLVKNILIENTEICDSIG